ncbi:MAG TPA: GNAT family N-acetyltransferase [Firmicutes bacterium]|nr:GNAT family N-acetyltransferase [Bacillota bacterium]
MGIVIRKAALEDMDLLVQWRMEVLREVFSIPPGQPTGELEKENRRYYQRALQTGEHMACFACLDNAVIGCGGVCFYQEMPSPDNPTGKCAYLMNLYVRPPFRRRGAGEALLKWLVSRAAKRGTPKIYLETSEAGKPLYIKAGFVPMRGMMKLPAGEEGGIASRPPSA